MTDGMSMKVRFVAADQSSPRPTPVGNGKRAGVQVCTTSHEGVKAAVPAVLSARDSCQTPVLSARDSCETPVLSARDSCQTPVLSARDGCQTPVLSARDGCQTPVLSARDGCQTRVETRIKILRRHTVQADFAKSQSEAPKISMVRRSVSVAADFHKPPCVPLEREQPVKLQTVSRLPQDVSKAAIAVKSPVKEASTARNDGHITKIRPQANFRVLCYGDSNTAGFCSKGKRFEPYARSLDKALRAAGVACEVYHAGLSGLTAAELADKMDNSSILDICEHEYQGLRKMIGMHKPDVVIIMAGTNDICKGAEAAETMEPILRLHEACHEKGIPTIALAPPAGPGCTRRDNLARALKHYASVVPNVVAYGDAEELLPRGPLGYWEPDIIHFSPAGSSALGQLLGPLVIQSKKIADQPKVTLRHACAGA